MAHLHFLLWPTQSPRIDIAAKDEKAMQSRADIGILLVPEVAELVADYFGYFVSETHPLKPQSVEENKLGPSRKYKKSEDTKTDPASIAWGDLRELLEGGDPDSEESFDVRLQVVGTFRFLEYARLARTVSWRRPFERAVLR